MVYEGQCSCGGNYIGEIGRNFEERTAEYNNPAYNPEPAKHIRTNPTHVFKWTVEQTVHQAFKTKIVDSLLMLKKRPFE